MESAQGTCPTSVPGTSLQPVAEFVNQQRQPTHPPNRPRNSNQAQRGSFDNSHPRAPNVRNQHRGAANEHRSEFHHGSNNLGNRGHRSNRAPNRGGSNAAKDRDFSSAPHGKSQTASQANGYSDQMVSQICAVLKTNDRTRMIPVPSDQYSESPQSMAHPQSTTKTGGDNVHRKRNGWHNEQRGKPANETAKSHPHNQDAEYEQNGEALNKPQTNPISVDENGLEQTSHPGESKHSHALAASSLPDQPHKSHPNHHQQINAALNSSNQRSDTRSQAAGNSATRNCNMENQRPVQHETPRASKELNKSVGLRGGRSANNRGSRRGTSRWPRGCSSATESHEESLWNGSTFDPWDLDPVVNDNHFNRINIGRLPKYHYPGAKKTVENKPLRRVSNAPSHHVGRNAPQETQFEDSVPGTGTQKDTSSGVAHEAQGAAPNQYNPSPAAPPTAAQPALQPANGGASHIPPHSPAYGHVIEEEEPCQGVRSQPQGLSEAARSTAPSVSLKSKVSSCDQRPDTKTQGLSNTVLPPHLRLGSSKKAAVAVPNVFASPPEVNKIKDQKADGLPEDTLSRKETQDNRHLGHGLENIVNPSAPIAKVDEHHASLASMSHHTDTVVIGNSIPVNKAASNKVSEVNWEGAWLDPPIGNDWNMRPQHPVEERKAVTHAFAEEQAVDPGAAMPVVDIHSPSFLSGLPVLDDEGVHELNLNETRPRLKARRNGHASKSSKTAEDRIKEHAVRVANVEILQPTARTVEEKREIRRIIIKEHRNRPSPPNLHAPVANIYLRPVETKDAGQITDLWNHFVSNSTDVPTLDLDETVFWHREIKRVIEDHEPFLVAIVKGDNSSRSFREARRLKQEHVVGFARATDYGASGTVYQYTVELEVFVRDGHMRKGIGKCLFDRMMNALSPRYDARNGVPLICTPKGGELSWRAGQWRSVKTILINLLGQEGDEAVAWKKKWLAMEDFHQCGFVPNIGCKLGKLLHQTQFYYDTGINL